MEIFREIGIADAILERCQNVFERARITWVTSLSQRELGHCSALPDDLEGMLALSPVHATHYPQNRLEPLLWEKVQQEPRIEFLPGHECVGVHETEREVVVSLNRNGAVSSRSGTYLVACDGASSRARNAIGVPAAGRVLQHMMGIYFTADLTSLVARRKSILYWILNPRPHRRAHRPLAARRVGAVCALFSAAAIARRVLRTHVPGAGRARRWMRATGPQHQAGAAVGALGEARGRLPARTDVSGGRRRPHLSADRRSRPQHGRAGRPQSRLEAGGGHRGSGESDLLDTYEQERRPVARINLEHSVRNYERMSDLTRIAGVGSPRSARPSGCTAARESSAACPHGGSGAFWRQPFAWRSAGSRCSTRKAKRAPGRGGVSSRPLQVRCPTTGSWGSTLDSPTSAAPSFPTARQSRRRVTRSSTIGRPRGRAHVCRISGSRNAAVRHSIHDLIAPGLLTLLVHDTGRAAWCFGDRSMPAGLAARVRCLAIGAGPDADLVDPRGSWRELSETDPSGAVLVRPDGHVAWRARPCRRTPPCNWERSSETCSVCRDPE